MEKFKSVWKNLPHHFLLRQRKVLTALLAVVFLAGAALWFVHYQHYKGTANAAEELQQLAQNIRRHYQNRPDFWGLSTLTVIEKQIAPATMVRNGTLQGFFGNQIVIGSGADGAVLMPGARNFDSAYKGLTYHQCRHLAVYDFGQAFWLGVSSVIIGNAQSETVFDWETDGNSLPIGSGAAKKACAESQNTIIWQFQ